MPPKNKASANGFMAFTFEWKAKYGKHLSLAQATTEAGKIWKDMSAQQRGPYNEIAKKEKLNARNNQNQEKLTCTGTPITIMEKEKMEQENKERRMKRDIETTVSKSVKRDELELQNYNFIMVNYFTKTLNGDVYLPAELAVCQYSLKEGVHRTYQTLINPGLNIYGLQYDAQRHSETTHNLPLPPNALGEKKLSKVYNDVLNFIRDESTNEYPPIYTHRDCIHVVESILQMLQVEGGGNNIEFKIYPIQYLFYIMKEATCEAGELEKPKNSFITDAFFERDFFEYQIGIACQYHEEIDKSKYCTKSYVTRWGFLFSDYMCRDIAIPLKPGRHCPENTDVHAIAAPAPAPPSTLADNESFISMNTTNSYDTKALANSKIYYDDQKTTISGTSKASYVNNFPALGARKKHSSNAPSSSSQPQKASRRFNDIVALDAGGTNDDYTDVNPWTSRSRNVPREPETIHFDVDDLSSDIDDFNSVASFGRGRASLMNASLNTTGASSTGRGRCLRPQKY